MPTVATGSRIKVAIATLIGSRRRMRRDESGFAKTTTIGRRRSFLAGIPELVEAMDSGHSSISAASEFADAHPDTQRGVLKKRIERIVGQFGESRRACECQARTERADDERRNVLPARDDNIRSTTAPSQRLEEVAGIAPGTVHLVLTDIFPYGQDFLRQVAELGAFAARVLVEGGLLVTYTGQFSFPTGLGSFEPYSPLSLVSRKCLGRHGIDPPGRVEAPKGTGDLQVEANPGLFQGGVDEGGRVVGCVDDQLQGEGSGMTGSSLFQELENLARDFSQPGDLIVDPLGGGFTTAVACQTS